MKRFKCTCALAALLLLAVLSASAAAAGDVDSAGDNGAADALAGLQTKINEVVNLKNGLEKKRGEMQNARTEYQAEIAVLKTEIEQERRSGNIGDYSQALKNKRIRNNLLLIQRQMAYIDKIDKLEFTLSQGIEEMLYLERKAKADMKIVRLLDNKDELVQKIDNSLKNYAPYATRFALDEKRLNFVPIKRIWQEMTPGQQPSGVLSGPKPAGGVRYVR